MILADKISELRRARGWSQEELADRINVQDSLFPNGRAVSPRRILTKYFSSAKYSE